MVRVDRHFKHASSGYIMPDRVVTISYLVILSLFCQLQADCFRHCLCHAWLHERDYGLVNSQ